MDNSSWNSISNLVGWLNNKSSQTGDLSVVLRVMKISEEVGEVAEALHGALGSNPRKGRSHTWGDVHEELCDVIVTSMVALASLTPDAQQLFEDKLRRIEERSLGGSTAHAGAYEAPRTKSV